MNDANEILMRPTLYPQGRVHVDPMRCQAAGNVRGVPVTGVRHRRRWYAGTAGLGLVALLLFGFV